jgi:hypothetical protein
LEDALKCLYYLAPTLAATHGVSDHLHAVGVKDFYLHVVAKDEQGLRQQHIHSANYLETLDVIRDGYIGAAIGFLCGLAGIGLLAYFQPFGASVPTFVYVVLVAVATLFGAWVGGLTGVDHENKKLRKFHEEIEAGKYLMLVYVRRHQEATVRAMMQENHPEAALAGIDTHFINPFNAVKSVSEPPVSKAPVGD